MNHEKTTPQHTNRLAREKSPYLLQHAHNPVDWFAWGDEAFARASHENKPIFLSIGYSTCHWCHVMERESFEDKTVGAYLNEHFVSIKVDREERPDVDKIYMTFVQATTGSGGWPLNVFLTPDRKPFYGGTYFPPDNRHGRASFLHVLQQLVQVWNERREELAASADEIHARMEAAMSSAHPAQLVLTADVLRHAGELFKGTYDPQNGGFGGAPKFPQPSIPLALLRCAKRFHDAEAARMVLHTCERMAAGGIHDQLGGGFARYAVDAHWLVPHFEKMLYDNAQLAQLYLDAYLVSGDIAHANTVRDILDYVLRDMTHSEGGFYSAEDADSEGHEGKFYCWTYDELAKLLSPEEFNVAARHFGITKAGNFIDHSHPNPLHGQNVLSVVHPLHEPDSGAGISPAKGRLAGSLPHSRPGDSEVGRVTPCAPGVNAEEDGAHGVTRPTRASGDDPVGTAISDDTALLAAANAKMLAARVQRVRPHLDDKILASWNGLMLGAMARAFAVLGDETYRAAAEKNLAFLRDKLWDARARRLYHRWREGERDTVQLLEAYAFLLDGVLHLYEATLSPPHLDFASELAEVMIAQFYDPEHGGFWQSGAGATDLILRVKDDYDGAEPSGNSVATLALLKLAAITGRADFHQPAEATLRLFATRLEKMPQAVPYLLLALDFWLDEPRRVVIAGDPDAPRFRELLRAAHGVYQPNKVVLGNTGAVEPFARTLPTKAGPLAYVCTGTACQEPTSDPQRVQELLK